MKNKLIFLISVIFLNIYLTLEVINDYSYVFFIFLLSAALGLILNRFTKQIFKKTATILMLISSGLLLSYIIAVSIHIMESKTAYNKIKSIPKEKLIEFYKTKNIELIPKESRHTWIGLFYKQINVIPKNRLSKIQGVGWDNSIIIAYYNIDDDEYYSSVK